MDPFHKHILERLDALEGELGELREVTWPVCQGLLDKTNPLNNLKQKRKLLRWLDDELIKELLRLKAIFMGLTRDQVAVELRQVLVEEPRLDAS
jgi:hypothetical protein